VALKSNGLELSITRILMSTPDLQNDKVKVTENLERREDEAKQEVQDKSINPVPTPSAKVSPDNRSAEDKFTLKVKPEFVNKNCVADTLPSSNVRKEGTPQEKDERVKDENGKNEKRKNRRGRNKKRPRDMKIDEAKKACMLTMRGEVCPFGDSCKYSHDLKEMLANRPPDITQVEKDENNIRCPRFRNYNFCEFGVMCRVGEGHINMATGTNVSKVVDGNVSCTIVPKDYQSYLMNILTKEVQTKLRKRTYPFKCKRHNEKKDQKADTETLSSNDTPALPAKERKLIDFSNKVYVAPLTTVGNLPFRRIMKGYGADITCGEMAIATALLEGKSSEWALLKRHPCEDIFGVQIAAGFPDQATRVSELIEAECNVDWVDMNLGCPLDLVCEKGAGAKLMMRENNLKGCLKGLSSVLSCPFTIKIRTGWDEKKPFAHKLIPKVQSWGIHGLNAIMLHGRSRTQRYSRLANWDYISEVAMSQSDEFPKIPIIGNGDVFSYTDYEEKVEREGVQATAMIARGALIKPWLPTEIKEKRHWDISSSERLDMLKEFVKFGLEHWGSDQQGVNNTRRFFLEWQSFLWRYVPVGILEVVPQQMNKRPPTGMYGRNDLETLMMSGSSLDWIKLSEMLLGPVPDDFKFEPKHKANSYAKPQ